MYRVRVHVLLVLRTSTQDCTKIYRYITVLGHLLYTFFGPWIHEQLTSGAPLAHLLAHSAMHARATTGIEKYSTTGTVLGHLLFIVLAPWIHEQLTSGAPLAHLLRVHEK